MFSLWPRHAKCCFSISVMEQKEGDSGGGKAKKRKKHTEKTLSYVRFKCLLICGTARIHTVAVCPGGGCEFCVK